MRLQAILPTLLLATASALSYGAYSATDADKAQPADVKTDQPTTKIAKPQCHMDENSGMTQQTPASATPEQKCAKLTAGQDRSKHYHPRDGK